MNPRMHGLILALALTLVAPAAFASHWPGGMGKHNGKFWKRDKVREKLNLTPEEVQDLEQIFGKTQQTLIDCEADVKKKKIALDTAFADDQVDDQQVLAEVDLLEQSRAKLAKARVIMLREMRRVLTPAQREALAGLKD